MAMASNYLERNILNHFLRGSTVSSPGRVYLALYTNDPTDANTGAEVRGGGYERQQVSFSAPTTQTSGTVIKNSSMIEFPAATGDWGRITHWGILDSKTGGNLLVRGSFNRLEEILSGHQFIVDAGNLVVSVD